MKQESGLKTEEKSVSWDKINLSKQLEKEGTHNLSRQAKEL